jgi:glucosamine--fructose-6-phosphate aminotransferase (isomerizing)
MTTFDPDAPLPGPPTPWASTDMPSRRGTPPFHMTDMIAAEPALGARLVRALADPGGAAAELAAAVRTAIAAGDGVVVTGCGTSEHAAIAVAEILRDAATTAGLRSDHVRDAQAFELALEPPSHGLVIGVSHEGGTAATNRTLERARAAGARTALITVSRRAPGASNADIVVETHELDQGWCHVVGYLSPILAGAAVGAHVSGRGIDPDVVRTTIAHGDEDGAAAEGIAGALSDVGRIIVLGSGADRAAGRELVLKIEEGSWIPAAYRDLETFLHGHLPATDETTGLVLLLAEPRGREERATRARQALAAARTAGIRTAAIVAEDAASGFDEDLTSAGRLLSPAAPDLPAPVAALLGSATRLQLLAERLARARGTNPDPIRRDDPRYAAAAAAAEG